jgi:hypothetical protein
MLLKFFKYCQSGHTYQLRIKNYELREAREGCSKESIGYAELKFPLGMLRFFRTMILVEIRFSYPKLSLLQPAHASPNS